MPALLGIVSVGTGGRNHAMRSIDRELTPAISAAGAMKKAPAFADRPHFCFRYLR